MKIVLAAALAGFVALPAFAGTTIVGSAAIVDLGTYAAGTYHLTGTGVVDLVGGVGSGFDILPDGSLAAPVTSPSYLYFNPNGSYTADGSFGPAGTVGKIGALVGTLTASPASPADYFLIGFGTNITLAAAGHIYAGVNDTYSPNNGGSFSVDVTPVPEPASWALMLGGFALVGAALRRRVAAVAA